MRDIVIKNKNNKTISISENGNKYIPLNAEGLGGLEANLYSSKSPNQDGGNYHGSTLQGRPVHIELAVLAENKVLMHKSKSDLMRALNPKIGEVELVREVDNKKRKLVGILENISFPYERNFEDSKQTVLIDIYCNNPYYRDVIEQKAEIAIWKPSFEFPWDVPPEGIDIGYREPSLIANILNQGDVKCGMRIVFKANATVENPSLFNVNTREYFKVNKTLLAGESVVVTTGFQNKRVKFIKNGVVTTLHDWDYTSTFLQLDVGDNLFRYDAENGLDNLEVDVYYTQQYLGV